MKIKHLIGNELISIFKEIINQKLNIEEWSLIESSEQFQTPNYSGGFEATENEFTLVILIIIEMNFGFNYI